jgi:hypothetical protein
LGSFVDVGMDSRHHSLTSFSCIMPLLQLANHHSVLPIFSVTVVSLCILLNTLEFPPKSSPLHTLCITREFHHHLRRQLQECSSHILSDCSLALCPPKSTLWSLTNRCLLPSSIHTIFGVRLQIVVFWIHGIFHCNTILFENRLHI